MHSRSQSPAQSSVKMCLRAIILLLLCGFMPTSAQEDRHPQRGFHPGNSYSFSEIETISMANGNLGLSIPLGSLPAGRGGSPGFTLGLTYNSKSYDSHVDSVPNELGQDESRSHLNFSEDGGWRYTLPVSYELRALNRLNEEPGPPCAPGVTPFEYQRNSFVWKVQVIYPDGSAREFRPVGYLDEYADGFFNISPNGWLFEDSIVSIGTDPPNASCSHSETLVTTAPMVYYSTDGSYTRLVVEHSSNPADHVGSGNQWTLFFPDGGRVANQPNVPQRLYDRNNRYLDHLGILHNNHPATKIIDELGRFVIVEIDSQSDPFTGVVTRQDYVYVKGTGGEEMRWTIRWKQIYVYKEYRATVEMGGIGRGNNYLTPWEGILLVVDQITLPSQAGGLTYEFGYNAGDYVGDTQQLSYGWGELSSVTLPSGAKASYTYGLDGSTATAAGPTFKSVLKNRPNRKELTYRQEYDLAPMAPINNTPCDPQVEACTTEVSTYGAIGQASLMTPHTTSIMGPDGGTTIETIEDNVNSPYHGRTLVSVQPDGTKVENLWRENRAPGMNGGKVNPFVKSVFTSIKDAAGNYVLTATKDYDYDKNGNVTRIAEYDWVAYSGVPPTGPPEGVAPKRVTTNTYYAATPDALDLTSDDPDIYHRVTAPQLLSAAQSTEMGDGGIQPLARTEFFYDNSYTTGNLTEGRTWDSQEGAHSNPLSSLNSISVINEYDPQVLGKLTHTTDPRGFRTEYTYGPISGFSDLYPTESRVAAGTTVQRTERREYDFDTGLVTRVTDADNSVSGSTTYDVFGRSTLAKAAEGRPEEARTATEYSDVNRRVIVRADLNIVGDAKLVSIQHYDQLGRVRLTRQLEDAAQSATDETKGIKVQIRYKSNGTNSSLLVSNAYRAATSGAATAEMTMGWGMTTTDQAGRVARAETFEGASLPAPWGENFATTGAVVTAYNAEAVSVTDQASRSRKSVTDGLGRLAQVFEAPGVTGYDYQTSYTYDALSNLTQVTQGTQTPRSFAYSSLSRLVLATNPESGSIRYEYDAGGNLEKKVDARHVQTDYDYDPLNRVVNRVYSIEPGHTTPPDYDAAPNVAYFYDSQLLPTGAPVFERGLSAGRLVAVTYGGGILGRYTGAYDALGRAKLSRQVTDAGTAGGVQTYAVACEYDLAGNLKSETYPSGKVVMTEYDTAGRVAGVKNQATGGFYAGAASLDTTNRFQYVAHGAMSAAKLGNGLWEHTNFNSRLQPMQIGLGTSVTDSSKLQLDYTYGTTDNNGNMLSQTITIPGLTLAQTYGYDLLNRLETAGENAGVSWKEKFVYDRYGNRRIDADPANTSPDLVGPNPVLSEANNRIVAQAGEQYQHDAAGNLTRGREGQTYFFDAENKMSSFNGGASQGGASYSYDGDGMRVKKVVGTTTTIFVYNTSGQLIAEYANAEPELNGMRYLTSDHLGSPRVVTDSNGVVKSRHDCHPFGEEVVLRGGRSDLNGYIPDKLRQKFTSYERDNETGLDYAHARYYASSQGRFTSADIPLMDQYKTEPQSWNLYSYVGNKPLTYTDPFGLWKQRKCEGGTCWESDNKDDTFESLAKILNVSAKALAEHFQNQKISMTQVFEVSGFFANNTPVSQAPRTYFEVIIWKPAPRFESIAGHVSFNVNGLSYSREKWGWDVRPFSEYLKEQTWRNGIGYVLDDENDPRWATELAEATTSFHGKWGPRANCSEPFCSATKQMGLPNNDSLLPVEQKAYILHKLRPYIRAIITYNRGTASGQRVGGR